MVHTLYNLTVVFSAVTCPSNIPHIQGMLATMGVMSAAVVVNPTLNELSIVGDVDGDTLLDLVPNLQEAVGSDARLIELNLEAIREESYGEHESRHAAFA